MTVLIPQIRILSLKYPLDLLVLALNVTHSCLTLRHSTCRQVDHVFFFSFGLAVGESYIFWFEVDSSSFDFSLVERLGAGRIVFSVFGVESHGGGVQFWRKAVFG